jgi:hypothetical protein
MQPQNALVVGHAGSRCLAQSCLAWSARRVAVRVSAVCDVRPSGGAKLLPVGAVLHGTFPGRPNDIAGIDFQQNLFNPRVTGFVDDEIAAEGLKGHVSSQDEILEVNYSLKLAPGLQMKPYTAYTWHPDQDLFDVEPDPRCNTPGRSACSSRCSSTMRWGCRSSSLRTDTGRTAGGGGGQLRPAATELLKHRGRAGAGNNDLLFGRRKDDGPP